MNITLFTDASFCPNTKAAGGAFWARADVAKPITGQFKLFGVGAAHEAELRSAFRSILYLVDESPLGELFGKKGNLLILVVDCMAIKQVFDGVSVKMAGDTRDMFEEVRAYQAALKFPIKVNHVPAHKGINEPRKWVNADCDHRARQQMEAMRNTINKVAAMEKGALDGLI